MKKLFFVFGIIVPLTFFTQTAPVLKVYVNTKEVFKPDYAISAYAKIDKDFIPILDTGGKKITVPKGIDITMIEAFKFIVSKDTIVFGVDKILEDPKRAPEKNPMDDLKEILTGLKAWDLRIDNFHYLNEDAFPSGNDGEKPNQKVYPKIIYKEYKIYALRTRYLRYYIVKS
jgi:hypothetical protein